MGRKQNRNPMDTPAAEVLVPLIVFASIFGIVYVAISAQHKQRMAMIDKGMSLSDLIAKKDPNRSLKFGLLGLGVGLGLLLGYLLDTFAMKDDSDNPLPYLIMVSICGGVALLTYYSIVRKKEGTPL